MEQPTFADLEYDGKKRKTRRERFLERMDGLIPWDRFEDRIRPFYPKAGRGRRPYDLSVMLRIHCVQLFYNLSDPAMEDMLYEIESVRGREAVWADAGRDDDLADIFWTPTIWVRVCLRRSTVIWSRVACVFAIVDASRRWCSRPRDAPDEEGQRVVLRDESCTLGWILRRACTRMYDIGQRASDPSPSAARWRNASVDSGYRGVGRRQENSQLKCDEAR